MKAVDEKHLVDALSTLAVRRRDRDAWETVYRLMRPFVYSVVYRRLRGSADLAEDATQEVFLRLVRSFPFGRLREVDAFRGYVWRVANNVALTYQRRILAHPTTQLDTEFEETSAAEDRVSMDWVGDVEVKELLSEVWPELSTNDRKLLRMLLAGHSIGEIGRAFGLAYGAAALRVWRLRVRLRKSHLFNGIEAATSA
jgi:RNA polymerase sigma-70 factor (ECF subfamily)